MTSAPSIDPAVIGRIRALLAQAESTNFPDEAEAFTAKASELMARYAIDAARLWHDHQTSASPDEVRIELVRPFIPQKAILVSEVAAAFRCRAIRLQATPAGSEPLAVVGFADDLELVSLLASSLLVQLSTAMAAARPRSSTETAAQVASWKRSFIIGFSQEIRSRLEADQRRAGATDGSGAPLGASTAIVLADRSAAVGAEFRRRFPTVRTTSVSAGRSARGRAAGQAAGRRADLAKPRIGGRAALGPPR